MNYNAYKKVKKLKLHDVHIIYNKICHIVWSGARGGAVG
jgi:hypothetical protein